MYLIFDTETTGLPKNYNAPITDHENWPRLVQIAWQLHDAQGYLIESKSYVVKPEGFTIPFNSAQIHGITTEKALAEGEALADVLNKFQEVAGRSEFIVGHNISFDLNIMGAEMDRMGLPTGFMHQSTIDTKDESTEFCAIPGGRGGKFKWPTLSELHQKLFDAPFDEAHNAIADVEATARCFFKLGVLGVIPCKPPLAQDVMHHLETVANQITAGMERRTPAEMGGDGKVAMDEKVQDALNDAPFAHLHVHSQFSILESTLSPEDMVRRATENGHRGVAMTDRSFMYGAFNFTSAVQRYNASRPEGSPEFKGVVGVEFYLAADMRNKQVKDNASTLLVLAKNHQGYKNLSRLSTAAITEGMYYVPRIDKNELLKYREGLMVLSGSIHGELSHLVLNVGETQAEEALLWYHEHFKDDFYVTFNRHGLPEEEHVINVLKPLCEQHGVTYVAANDVFYGDRAQSTAQDTLICIRDGEVSATPKGKGRGFRNGLPNDSYYFKSQQEMAQLFSDMPEAIENIAGLLDKVSNYSLHSDVLLPNFEIPEEFEDPQDKEDGGVRGQNKYLRHLTYLGAERRYGEVTDAIRERLDFELSVIENTGYPGYFLIVQDFTTKAREMGVSVGPGRGSAAGSAVAYCIGITNVDPIKYDLLFERFLNPERVSLPDIDIDFDDEGRGKVIQYVVDKYGSNQVAQIITFGKLKAKSAIRDAARALDLPLSEADRLAKLMPIDDLNKLLNANDADLSEMLRRQEETTQARQLKAAASEDTLAGHTLRTAKEIEGSVRNTGIHACGVIITPTDIRDLIPVTTAKDADLLVTQFDNNVVENAGLLKMDFLGLKTLTIIRKAVQLVELSHGIKIDPDQIPLDDAKTYELFHHGETVGIFQFESVGMQKYLRDLKPDALEDLIAMNALYRPGPLQYIPEFIDRKHGRKTIQYDLPVMEEFLKETYGITVYQEQVMLLSQKLANFSKGQADALRKGMGKKKKEIIDALYPMFIEGGVANGHPKDVLEKIWRDWEEFASYAFNKSHSTCYAYIAYQTAYFKANYPAEFMAAVLSNNMNNIKEVTLFMDECKRMEIPLLGPDVNQSSYDFIVRDGAIRFGLEAIKGVGSNAVQSIIQEREEQGPFTSIFDLTSRVNLSAVNRRTLENLAQSGAFDGFEGHHRAQFFHENGEGRTFLESAIKYGQNVQGEKNNQQMGLFADTDDGGFAEPELPDVPRWNQLVALKKEEEVTGIYISGHPLDDYRLELKYLCTADSDRVNQEDMQLGKPYRLAGMVREVRHLESKSGNGFGFIKVMDLKGGCEIPFFGEDYLKFRHLMVEDAFVYVEINLQKREFYDRKTQQKVKAGTRLHVTDMGLLTDLIEKSKGGVRVQCALDQVSDDWVQRMSQLFDQFPGDQVVKIDVYDRETQHHIPFYSQRKIKRNKAFLAALDKMEEVNFKID